mmetsp:Transcript_90648/g.293434  ORF Transcript_90648/g.293434 Transcript_90648/m.293434 type:complete len:350 (-) Transcript_90648:92-1141(-)
MAPRGPALRLGATPTSDQDVRGLSGVIQAPSVMPAVRLEAGSDSSDLGQCRDEVDDCAGAARHDVLPEGAVEAGVGNAAGGEGEGRDDAGDVSCAQSLGWAPTCAKLKVGAVCDCVVHHQARACQEERCLAGVEDALRDLSRSCDHPLMVYIASAHDLPCRQLALRRIQISLVVLECLSKPILPARPQAPGVDAQRMVSPHVSVSAGLPHAAAGVGQQGKRGHERRHVCRAGGVVEEVRVDDLEALLAVGRRCSEESSRVLESQNHAADGRRACRLVGGRQLPVARLDGCVDGSACSAEEDSGNANVNGAACRLHLLGRIEPHRQWVRGRWDVLGANERLAICWNQQGS